MDELSVLELHKRKKKENMNIKMFSKLKERLH